MPRAYRSSVRADRADRTRARVLAAATDLFSREGWTPTTMARVAEAAGVSRQTVYQLHDGKLPLLDACIDAALSEGTDRPVREQAGYRAMGEGGLDARLAAGAGWLAEAHARSARIQHVLDEAAVTDPAAAALLDRREHNRWLEVRFAMGLVLSPGEPSDHLVDAVWTLASRDLWIRLVDRRGWSADDWSRWFVRTVGSLTDQSPVPGPDVGDRR